MAREVTRFSTLSGAETAQIGWTWLTAGGTLTNILTAIETNFSPECWVPWRPQLMDTMSITERRLEQLDPASGELVGVTPLSLPAAPSGGNSGFPLPPQCAFTVSIRTAVPGPSGRGRFYLPGIPVVSIGANGRMTNAYRDLYIAEFCDYVRTVELSAGAPQLGVWSKKNLAFFGATSVDGGNVVDTQRRRRAQLVEARYSEVL